MNTETHPKRRALKQRFDRLLPKYGFLWKSMIQAEQKKASKPSFDFVSAIENKERTVFVAADCQCPFQDCQGCEEPILQEYQQSPTNSSATSDDNINDESKPSSTPDHRIRGDPNNSADAAALDTLSLGDDSVDFDFSKLNLSNDRSAAGFEDDEDSGNTEEDKQHDAKSKIADTFVDETIYDQANNESPEKYSTPTGSASDFQSDVRTPRKTTGDYSVDSDSDDSSTDTIVGPSKQPDNSFDALEDTPPKSKHFSRPDAFATPPSESKKDPENEEEIGEDDDAKSCLVPDDDCDDMYSSGSEEFSMGDEVIEIDSDLEEDWSDNNQATSSVDQGVIDLVESDEEEAPRKSTFSRGSSFKEKIPRKTKGEKKSNHFAKNRQKIVDAAFAEFNEIVFQGQLSQVEVTWSKKLRTTAGITRLCCTKEKGRVIKRSASIELSMKVLDDETRLRSTLLHECCHAAQWLVDETSKPAHGKVFKKWANRAMESIPGILVTTTHDYEIQYKYAWACQTEKCGAVIQRQSRSIDVEKQVCGRCKGRLFEIEVPKRGTGKSVDKTPKKQRTLSDYNRFIKQNSAQVRTRLTLNLRMTGDTFGKVTQGDVMKECAKLWKEQKENP